MESEIDSPPKVQIEIPNICYICGGLESDYNTGEPIHHARCMECGTLICDLPPIMIDGEARDPQFCGSSCSCTFWDEWDD
jgi:hypothetical protein